MNLERGFLYVCYQILAGPKGPKDPLGGPVSEENKIFLGHENN